jgi:hypothetical protein
MKVKFLCVGLFACALNLVIVRPSMSDHPLLSRLSASTPCSNDELLERFVDDVSVKKLLSTRAAFRFVASISLHFHKYALLIPCSSGF